MPEYNSSSTEQFMGSGETSGSPWRLFMFMLIVFSVILLSWIGLDFGYRTYLNSSIEQLNKDIEISSDKLEITEENDLVTFYSQTVNLKGVLDSHIFGSKIFPFLQDTTHKKVAYTSISLDIPQEQINIDGLASSFDILVQQLAYWQQNPAVESITLNENSTVNDLVKFGASVFFKKDFFLFSDAYRQPVSPNPAQP